MAVSENFILEMDHTVTVEQDETLVDRVGDDLPEALRAVVELRLHVVLRFEQVLHDVEDGGGCGVPHIDLLREVDLGQAHHELVAVFFFAGAWLPIEHALLDEVGDHAQRVASWFLGIWPLWIRVDPLDGLVLLVLHGDEQLLCDLFELGNILLGEVIEVGDHQLLVAANGIEVALDLFADFLMDLRASLEPILVISLGTARRTVDHRLFEGSAKPAVQIVVLSVEGDLLHN